MPSNTAARIGPIAGIWQSRFQAFCFLLLRQQLAPHSQAQHSQTIKFLVVKLGSPAYSELVNLL